ncbi:CocE/NonD family hydrolase C-terminal non-catalytic domain-containing protein [Variovorax sp. GT1P44]|uniref:CocE/NonD family hydrolase C-terminal non-catalytic domain-containing protein n=1 Tax=Variovorax sp. GT1P44 TaxID=3443742 RepID=UPI003F46F56A
MRYVLPEAEGWRTATQWPVPEASHRHYALGADGTLAMEGTLAGVRTYMNLGAGLNRPGPRESDPPAFLCWDTAPLAEDLDMVGPIELQLDAASTAPDTAFIAVLQDVAPDGRVTDITSGFLRAGLRAVDEAASRLGAPVLPCDRFESVPIGETVAYRIPLVPNARRFKAGHRVRLYLTSDDQSPDKPALLQFRHASIGTSSLQTVSATSRLVLPVVA